MAEVGKEADIVARMEILERAEKAKRRRFTRNGLILVLLSIIFIGIGLILGTGPASWEGFFVGVGFLILISGIICLLIALINPFTSDEVRRYRQYQRQSAEPTEEGS